jgi:hypothetical protein
MPAIPLDVSDAIELAELLHPSSAGAGELYEVRRADLGPSASASAVAASGAPYSTCRP